MIRKKIVLIVKIIFVLIVINGILLAIQYLPQMKVDSIISNMNEYTQEDKILLDTGGVTTFPTTPWNRLYLYDVEHNKWKLIKSSMIPYYGFGSKFILNKQKIYYNRFGAEEGIELYSKKTKGFGFGKEELDQAGICTISPEYMYYLKESGASDFKNNIYRKNLKTGKTEVFLKGEFSYILRQDHGKLYTYNNVDKQIYEINLSDKTIVKCKNRGDIMWAGYIDDEHFMVTDGLNVYSYDKKSKKKKYYIKDLKKEEDFLNDNLKIDNNKLYYSTNNMDVFVLDIKTGEIKKIASESKNNKNSAWTSVIFTKSYIVIDITGEDYKNRKMYIYSYDGKLIRKVNVQPVW